MQREGTNSDYSLNREASPNLHIQKVVKHFGSFTALNGIDLDIRKGELLCLLGPSGCGKTTLLRIIAGLEGCDSGAILMRGMNITHLPASKRGCGIVFQSYALFPNLTIAQNIAYGLKGTREGKLRRITELLELIGLSGLNEHFPGQLSGGQQQRVALARALATSPSLLLLDEPLSALDARVREHLRREIRNLQQKLGITTILVTHDQEEALVMADRIVVMNKGCIEQVGTAEEIYALPQSRFVANFVGAGNWISATVITAHQVTVGDAQINIDQACHPDTQVELFLRPEELVLHPIWKSSMQQANTAMAYVGKVELLGSYYRVGFIVPHWGNLHLVGHLSREQYAALPILSEQMIPLSLPAHALKVFPATTANQDL